MEDVLNKLVPLGPRPELRERILQRAHVELTTTRYLGERMWSSRLFWVAALGAVLLGLLLPYIALEAPAREIRPVQPSPEAVSLAATLSATLGDGAKLQNQFAAQLSGPVRMPGDGKTDIVNLTRGLEWGG